MSSKLVTFLKMLILSLGLIAVVAIAGRNSEDKVATSDTTTGTSYDFAMGTSIAVNVYSNQMDFDKEGLKNTIVQEIKTLDEDLLSWRSDTSELGRLNNSYVANHSIEISPELCLVLKQSLDICRESNGALDITIRPLAALWNIEGDSEEEFVPPSDEDIKKSLEQVGYDKIELLSETYSTVSSSEEVQGETVANYYASISHQGVIIDLGATGKGYALDKAKDILEESDATGALISVGGSILVYGEKSSGDSWKIGVRDPLRPNDTSAMIGAIELPAGTVACVSTSGGYEKYKTYQGKDYHHILDSKTGYPADSGLLSVTVVCDNGLVSDGLSTACFVLGYEDSLALLEKYNAEAVFMDSNGEIIVTDGLKDSWVEY